MNYERLIEDLKKLEDRLYLNAHSAQMARNVAERLMGEAEAVKLAREIVWMYAGLRK